jgi:hypothetical protein
MAYGLKYTLPWKDIDNNSNIVEIYQDLYTGSVTELIATDTPAVHKYERSDNEDILSQIMSSTLTISFYSTEFTDFRNFFSFSDTEFFILYKFSGVEQFRGYLLNDITGEPFQDPPYPVVLTATDGLAQLKEVSLEGPENDIDLFTVIRETLNILNLELNIEVCNDLYEGLVQDNTKSIFAQDANKNLMIQQGTFDDLELNAYEFLDEICKSFGWALYQKNGRWLLQRSIARMIDTTVIYIHSWDTGEVIASYSVAESADAVLGNWISRVSALNNNWQSVVYGDGLWVAISNQGFNSDIMTSPDGITWTIRTTPSAAGWNSITYGNGIYVAVRFGGTFTGNNTVLTSPDGINWTLRSAIGSAWNDVHFANGLFVAVGNTNAIMRSTDGINWASSFTSNSSTWFSVTYGNGLWVAVASQSVTGAIYTSPDAINWTTRNSPILAEWQGVTYGNGIFVAVAISGSRTIYSSDGITWNQSSPVNLPFKSVAFGNGYFVAVTGTNANSAYSENGINWTLKPNAANNEWNSVEFANNRFVAVSESGSGNRVQTLDITGGGLPDKIEDIGDQSNDLTRWIPVNADQLLQYQRPIKKLILSQKDLGQSVIENGEDFNEFSWTQDFFYELNSWTIVNDPAIPIQIEPENIPLQSAYDIAKGVSWDIKFIPNGANTDKPIISKPVFLDYTGLILDLELSVNFVTSLSGISVAIKHEDVNNNVKYLTVSPVSTFQVLVWDSDFNEFSFVANAENETRTLKVSSFILPTSGFYSLEIRYKGTTGNTVVKSVKTIPTFQGKRNPTEVVKNYITARNYTTVREEELTFSDLVITNSKNWLRIGDFPAIVFVEKSLASTPNIITTPTGILTQVDRLTDTVTSNTVNLNAGLWNGEINIQYVADTGFTINSMIVRIIPTVMSTPSFRISQTVTVISSQQRNLRIVLNDFPENDRFTVSIEISLNDSDSNPYQESIFAFTNIQTSPSSSGWTYSQTNISFENQALLGAYSPTLRDCYARNVLTLYNALSYRLEGSFRRKGNDFGFGFLPARLNYITYENVKLQVIGWEYNLASREANIIFGQVPTAYVYPID